jgi:hypothetical protein
MKLGDAAALFAQPLARGIDSLAGTDLQNCGGCKNRQARLNEFSDAVVDFFAARIKEKKSMAQYIVNKNILVEADGPEDAVIAAKTGGQVMSINVNLRPQAPTPPQDRMAATSGLTKR